MQGKMKQVKLGACILADTFLVPSNMILNKLGKPSIYLPACMFIWGTISAATAATESYGGLLACRFILGFIEAAYFVRLPHQRHGFMLVLTHHLAWLPLPPLGLVYAKGTRQKNRSLILRLAAFRRFLRLDCCWHYQGTQRHSGDCSMAVAIYR